MFDEADGDDNDNDVVKVDGDDDDEDDVDVKTTLMSTSLEGDNKHGDGKFLPPFLCLVEEAFTIST